jgi:7-cyano-7-deazaguanine reductase
MAENLLGKHTPLVERYSPQLLYPIPRQDGRSRLGLEVDALAFHGEDLWHAWELSWIGEGGVPQAAIARFSVPCVSPNLVESKSLKLYLNSINHTPFKSRAQLCSTLVADLSAVAGAPVAVELLDVDDPSLLPVNPAGSCLDQLAPTSRASEPSGELLQLGSSVGEGRYYSHLLRSLCPVTAQPDWATLVVHLRGRQLLPESLLAYILSFRQHQEFHEQCVERIYLDIQQCCTPDFLSVQALYTRRGGLDINPWRCSEPLDAPRIRTARQ